jgi:hypothetical protein
MMVDLRQNLITLLVLVFLALSAQGQGWVEQPWNGTIQSFGDGQADQPKEAGSPEDLSAFKEFFFNGTMSTEPSPWNISGNEPSFLMVGGQEIPYLDYSSGPRGHELWIKGVSRWAQHVKCPLGKSLQIIAFTPTGGTADLYRFSYTDQSMAHQQYQLDPGYYSMIFLAEEAGREILVLAVNDQPSNALIIDVLPGKVAASEVLDVSKGVPGMAKITIISEKLRGYDVYVDGVYRRNDGGDGLVDGIATFTVYGDRIHTIRINLRGLADYTFAKEFKTGFAYTLPLPQ